MKTMVVYLKRIVMCSFMFVVVNVVFAQDFQAKHEVQRGETLASIAKQYGVTEQMIKDVNPQMGNLFYVGLKLNIPKSIETKVNDKNKEVIEEPKVTNNEDVNEQSQVVTSHGGSYRTQYEEAAGIDSKIEGVDYSYINIVTTGLGYWSYDGGENWGIQISGLRYNGWASEINFRANLKKYGNLNMDIAFLGYSFGLTEFDNGVLYLALVAGPSIRYQTIYDWEDDEDKEKCFIDFYGAASLNIQLGERFLIKGGYNLWSAQFKFKEGYNADGVYVSVGYSF